MSKKTRLGLLAVNAEAKAVAELLNGGYLDFMTGEQPAGPDVPVSDDLRLARCSFGNVAFGVPDAGVLISNPLSKAVAIKTGEPRWVRCLTKNLEPVIDGNAGKVGQGDANALGKVDTIVEGQIVNITEFKHVVSKQGN